MLSTGHSKKTFLHCCPGEKFSDLKKKSLFWELSYLMMLWIFFRNWSKLIELHKKKLYYQFFFLVGWFHEFCIFLSDFILNDRIIFLSFFFNEFELNFNNIITEFSPFIEIKSSPTACSEYSFLINFTGRRRTRKFTYWMIFIRLTSFHLLMFIVRLLS